MVRHMGSFIRRFASDRLKGLLSWLGGGASWLLDKLFGDKVFAWVRPMLDPALNLDWLRLVWEYGVPFSFAALGGYFFWRAGRGIKVSAAAAPKLEVESSERSSSSAIASLAELGWTIKPTLETIQFELRGGSLPSMKESAKHFAALDKSFSIEISLVKDLKGLHYISKIAGCSKIYISGGEFTDISELDGFSYLTSLSIRQIPLNKLDTVDASPLFSLKQLERLNLYNTKIRDLNFLSSLIHLENVSISGTLVTDLLPIINLASLKELDIRETRITDLQPLVYNKHLSKMTIDGKQVAGLINLTKLQHLKNISIIEHQEFDLSPVSLITHLEELYILGPEDKIDVSSLRELTGLRKLSLSSIGFLTLTQVANIESISNMVNLEELTLGQMAVSDLSFINDLKNLSSISINQMPVSSIESLRCLKKLRKVMLVRTSVADVSSLLELPDLVELTVSYTPARSDIIAELERRGVKVTRY